MPQAPDAMVFVIDDDEAMRDSLAFLLDTAGLDVRTFVSGEVFLNDLPPATEGCVVTDVRMPGIDGLTLLARLRDIGWSLPVIVMTGHGDVPLAVQAMKLGAFDFIEKPFDDEAMLSAIRSALDTAVRAREIDEANADIALRVASLSQRERQVLDGLVAGHANKVIAGDLDISPRTVEIYRANVMTKMRANSVSELVRLAMRAGIAPA